PLVKFGKDWVALSALLLCDFVQPFEVAIGLAFPDLLHLGNLLNHIDAPVRPIAKFREGTEAAHEGWEIYTEGFAQRRFVLSDERHHVGKLQSRSGLLVDQTTI